MKEDSGNASDVPERGSCIVPANPGSSAVSSDRGAWDFGVVSFFFWACFCLTGGGPWILDRIYPQPKKTNNDKRKATNSLFSNWVSPKLF